jgi:hypothetical protein
MKQVILILLAVTISVGACGMKPRPPFPESPSFANIHETENDDDNPQQGDRLVVADAAIEIQSVEPDSVHARVIDMAFQYDGYVLNAGGEASSIRIPAENFREAIRQVEKLGKVTSEKITGQDVTDNFEDLEVRLNNAEKTRQRYLALLDQANSINEILTLERELERLNKEIELYKGKIGRLQHLVEYCTITVKTTQEIRPGPISYLLYGLDSGVRWMFVWN